MKDINAFEALFTDEPEKRVGEQVGNYRLIRWLGRGAFADVYLGEHLYLKTQSAIKMLHAHLSEKAVKDFLNEACTIARLEHPHIVHVLDYGVENGTPFLIMAYAPHGSLRQRYPEGTHVPLEQVVPLVQQIASALDYAHQQRFIHRDIKPENILLGAQDQVLLSDFGLALLAQNMHTQAAKAMAGTLFYMAPEMLQGKVHFASDQYALGIMTYEWLCGQRPFTGSSIQVGTQHVLTPPPSLCGKVPDLPSAVEHVVFKALLKDRSQRYENVTAFANALQDACKDTSSIDAKTSALQPSSSSSQTLLVPDEIATLPRPKPRQPSWYPGMIWQTVLLLVAIIAVIMSSMGFWHYYITSSRVSTQHTAPVTVNHHPTKGNPTTTASAGVTTNPHPRETVPATVHRNSAATMKETPTMIASATAPPSNGNLALSDPLSDNSRGYGWQEYAPNSIGASCQFIKGAYHVFSQKYYTACHAAFQASNFTFEVHMQIISGNCGGLSLRDTTSIAHAYNFEVCQDGSYRFNRFDNSSDEVVVASGSSGAIVTGLGQSNVIAAVANGSTFDLYVNQQKIASVNDGSYSQGQFGVSAFLNTEAAYTNARMWTM